MKIRRVATLLTAVCLAGGTGSLGAAEHEKHWGYEDSADSVGPAHWGDMAGNETCATGKAQTPIDLAPSAARAADLADLVFHYQPSELRMLNNGHTVQMTYDAGSTLGRAGSDASFKLAQFHFHAPSEHRLGGAAFPMELHLVHLDALGKPAAVVGIFVKAGRANAALALAFKHLPATAGSASEPADARIDAAALLPGDKTFFTYAGSLTTPPCSEGITWFVMKAPLEMSQEQIDAFTKLAHLGHTNRPIQALGARALALDSTPAH